ncbi:C-type lectin (CTL) or carbohydrate-recognition domain (CRD) [Tyrophagus putrescentiae]|nr:C-type lectin (CTL) or carbohydrate-recognition domain (CRD) [Tyrophagus putrescentiae]
MSVGSTTYRTLINAIRDTFDSSAGQYRRFDRSNSKSSESRSSPSNSKSAHHLSTSSHNIFSSSSSHPPIPPQPSPPPQKVTTTMSSAYRSKFSACTSYTVLLALALSCQLFLLHQGVAAQTCGYPGSPAHAIVSMSPQGPIQSGTTATYNCDNGYELLGPARRTCNENGTWTPLGIPFCGLSQEVLIGGRASKEGATAVYEVTSQT